MSISLCSSQRQSTCLYVISRIECYAYLVSLREFSERTEVTSAKRSPLATSTTVCHRCVISASGLLYGKLGNSATTRVALLTNYFRWRNRFVASERTDIRAASSAQYSGVTSATICTNSVPEMTSINQPQPCVLIF